MTRETAVMPAQVKKTALGLTAAGVLLVAGAAVASAERFFANWLVLMAFVLTTGVGALFLVALEHTVHSRWSVPFRRISENLSALILVSVILAVPFALSVSTLYEWATMPVGMMDHAMHEKAAYLNAPFFYARLAFCFVIWALAYWLFVRNSRKQDTSGDPALTRSSRRLGPPALILFAVTLTFASFDWIMSLTPRWYSTAFGMYFFSGAITAGLAVTTLASVLLKENGLLPEQVGRDHFYNLGGLLFAMNTFWAYIAFSQFMLIWYGNLPEELVWYDLRSSGLWPLVAFVLVILHFFVPFVALLARDAKSNPKRLRIAAVSTLVAHGLDLYWMVLPSVSLGDGVRFSALSWMDVGFPLLAVGIVLFVWLWRSSKSPIMPVGDPRLEDSLKFHL